MDNQFEKRYGLMTAICMVVGIVVGSGVFFKAEKILSCTGGRTDLGIIAWIIGGIIMISCACSFGIMASRKEDCNGIIDYALELRGEKYGYIFGWFMAAIFFPTQVAVLSWVTSKYFCALIGWEGDGPQCMIIAFFMLIIAYTNNILSPTIAGKVQVSSTVIKFIPLVAMALIGTFLGVKDGTLAENFSYVSEDAPSAGGAMFTAVCATAFAYEGWITATTISSEVKDSKKTLPRALLIGSLIIIFIYIAYYIGLSGSVDNETIMSGGEEAVKQAFASLFPSGGGLGLGIMITVSCYGALNGVMLGNIRSFYSLAVKGKGYNPRLFSQLDRDTNMPGSAGTMSLLLTAAWLLYYYGTSLTPESWFGFFTFDISEIPIITLYALYLPLFISLVKRLSGKIKAVPVIAIGGSIFMIIAAIFSHGFSVISYLIVFAVIMLIGMPRADVKHEKE